jgi:hypothetical protein
MENVHSNAMEIVLKTVAQIGVVLGVVIMILK